MWLADTGFNTGKLATLGTVNIQGTSDDLLYQTQRYDKSRNPELVYSFPVANGGYTVNLHLYRHNSGPLPMTAVVAISIKMSPNAPLRAIITENVNLLQQGQEITVTRFSLDDVGSLVPGSVHDLPRPLRSGPC